ncbi:MAG: DUF1844 domain-containing protein [Bdellovibrionales bacterium]|nr:DUF1844 domain-containing protein [Bdellovibrionales bacterium]
MAEKEDEPEFKVTDRRRFTATGQARTDVSDSPRSEGTRTQRPPEPKAATAPEEPWDGGMKGASHEEAPLDFISFVVSLATQALVMLGEIPNPETGQLTVNLAAAKQTIDIIGMLQDKTKGNLSAEEDKTLGEILASIRLAYVNKIRTKS